MGGRSPGPGKRGTRARLVAGFCWKFCEVRADGSLEPDVRIGDWQRPWNAKVPKGRAAPNPQKLHTPCGPTPRLARARWAASTARRASNSTRWASSGGLRTCVADRPVGGPAKGIQGQAGQESKDEMVNLVRNAYRVLLTRGIRETPTPGNRYTPPFANKHQRTGVLS